MNGISMPEKRKEQKSIAAKSKEACASFRKSTASDLAALKKRRRSVFEETQKSLTSIADEHAAAEAAWKPIADTWAAEHEQKISEIVKVILNCALLLLSSIVCAFCIEAGDYITCWLSLTQYTRTLDVTVYCKADRNEEENQ